MFRKKKHMYGEELLPPRPTPKLEDHPLPAVRDCLINIPAAYPPYWTPFLRPQPEDAPCRGDRSISLAQYVQNVIQNPAVKVNPYAEKITGNHQC